MQKIDTFAEVIQYLKDGEIVMLADRTAMFIKDGHIEVFAVNSHYRLSYKDFAELYKNSAFFLYQPSFDEIDMEKDAAYYAWKGRGVN
ncbi:MAG: hypothetical protein IJI05_02625 [Erysipelotrichaceae bacterium]|nr:hypothetical protein [Erysipelotrichaceae bacterium]